MADELLDPRTLGKLKWRCRRGLLENDIFIERFFDRYEASLTRRQAAGLAALMDLGDNDLLDLHLGRKTLAQVDPELDRAEVLEVLILLTPNQKTAERAKNETS
ncbi:MAG: succinate dehydrogenase assembly factor 2 [Burkholderiaceae bacterium]|jgi:antitoxin CptB|nr:MAG: succinate dehydrogenase assembly factor 2 [Burkholderiaceae bacterium]TBR74494.1 MAG: succinate dehydrogenase assembly factor 2 [Burkholderiaceae bacterium]